MKRSMIAAVLPIGLLGLLLGCQTEEQVKKIEEEVGALKIEVFKMRREMEEANRRAEGEQKASEEARKLDRRFQADLQETLRQLQDATRVLNGRLQEPAPRRTGKTASPDPAPTTPASDDEKAINAILLDYNRGNYALAADGLDLFVKGNAQSPKRPDALFYLGLCHWNQKAYDKAKVTFEQLMKEHPGAPQFLAARLKRAQCLKYLGLKPAAITAFKEIASGFEGSPEARTAQQELEDLGF